MPFARRVDDRDVPAGVSRDQPRHAQHRIGAEDQRIEEVVVDPAIDHVHLHAACDRAHPHAIVVDDQIGRLDQFDAHRIGEEAVLIIGRIVMTRRQHDAHRLAATPRRRHRLHRLQQAVGIAVDRLDAIFAEQLGAQPHHRLAVFEHVAHPRRRAGIVLQHEELVGPGAHQIDAADMRPDAVRRAHAGDLGAELRVAEDQVAGSTPSFRMRRSP